MRVSAILAVGNWPSTKQDEEKGGSASRTAQTPLACTEILGESVLQRTVERLRQSGVNAITVVAENSTNLPAKSLQNAGVNIMRRCIDRRTIAEIVALQSRLGVEMTLVMRVAAYIEFDLASMIRFHQRQGGILTRVCDKQGPLELWMMGAQAIRQAEMGLNSVAVLETTPDSPYRVEGYVNRLNDARDLRRLVVDSFLGRCAIRPRGREIKPGVWVGEGASIHRCARIIAPAYIGRRSKVRSSVLVTRFSSLEQNCVIERNTVIQNTSILSASHVGEDLEISHAVVDGNRLIHLRHHVGVTIEDAKLLGRTKRSTIWKMLENWRQGAPIDKIGPFEEINDPSSVVLSPAESAPRPAPTTEPVASLSLSRAGI